MTTHLELSERVRNLRPSATFAVNARVRELRSQGKDIIGFGTGEPDFETPAAIRDAAIQALRDGRTRYEPVSGPIDARRIIAEKLETENGIACDASHIVITCGAKHAIYLALQALVDPGRGQEVIILTPAWVSYRPMIELSGGVVVEVPGAVENDFHVKPDQLASAITPRTRAVLINSPSNPCGHAYEPDELRALADVLAEHEELAIISDEIYEKLIFEDLEHFSPGSVESIAERVVTINGMSKAYAMTGWRIGYVCAPGHDGEIARAIAKLQGQMTSHIASFCYPAVIDAITNRADEVEQMRRAFEQRAKLMHGLLTAMPDVRCPQPRGAFYVFPDIGAYFNRTSPKGRLIDSAVAFAEALLEEALVAVVPGDDFGECARTHVRLGFACSNEMIEEGCRRMHEWLNAFAA